MDCITISTFRSLEQQAIRQHSERLSNSNKIVSKETFGHENFVIAKSYKNNEKPTEELTEETTLEKRILNYFA